MKFMTKYRTILKKKKKKNYYSFNIRKCKFENRHKIIVSEDILNQSFELLKLIF